MVDAHGKITFKLLILLWCWKCPKGFKIGLEEAWESVSAAAIVM